MTEQENVAAIGAIYEAFGRGDIPYIIDKLTDEVRWVSRFEPIVPRGGDYSGKTKVPAFFQAINDSSRSDGVHAEGVRRPGRHAVVSPAIPGVASGRQGSRR